MVNQVLQDSRLDDGSSLIDPLLIDIMKGSYYANPVLDEPNVSEELRQAYPEYYGRNICKCEVVSMWYIC